MKFKILFLSLLLTSGFHAYAGDTVIVNEPNNDGTFAANTAGTPNIKQISGAPDDDKSCSCRCTAQGILLRECGGATENLGNYGNIKNCKLHKDKHPQCS